MNGEGPNASGESNPEPLLKRILAAVLALARGSHTEFSLTQLSGMLGPSVARIKVRWEMGHHSVNEQSQPLDVDREAFLQLLAGPLKPGKLAYTTATERADAASFAGWKAPVAEPLGH